MAIREIGLFQEASEREDGNFFAKKSEYKRIEDISSILYTHTHTHTHRCLI